MRFSGFAARLEAASAASAAVQDFACGLDAKDRCVYGTALAKVRSRAEQGGMAAQHHLGLIYARGHGVEQDHVQAVHWFRSAAEQKNPDSRYETKIVYARGLGLDQGRHLS